MEFSESHYDRDFLIAVLKRAIFLILDALMKGLIVMIAGVRFARADRVCSLPDISPCSMKVPV
jgi:hypothetical protein